MYRVKVSWSSTLVAVNRLSRYNLPRNYVLSLPSASSKARSHLKTLMAAALLTPKALLSKSSMISLVTMTIPLLVAPRCSLKAKYVAIICSLWLMTATKKASVCSVISSLVNTILSMVIHQPRALMRNLPANSMCAWTRVAHLLCMAT